MTQRTQKAGEDMPAGYRDLVLLGEGPNSSLFKAFSERLARVVAVKVAAAPVSGGAGRRFIRDAQELSRLTQRPHAVALLDVGLTGGGRPYTAREFFADGSLADLLEEAGPLPLADVVRVGVLIATALGAAHAQGILHQGVKPQNIMRAAGGFALADFAIPAFAPAPTASKAPVHCAPERLRGQPPTVAADVYSLGSTLFELLAARPPYRPEGGVASLLLRMLNDEQPRLVRADVPPVVAAVVGRAMARDAGARHASADEIAAELRAVEAELVMAGAIAIPSAWALSAATPSTRAAAAPNAGSPSTVASAQAASHSVQTATVPVAGAPLAAPGFAPPLTAPALAVTPPTRHPKPSRRRWPTVLSLGAVAVAAVGAPLLFSRSAGTTQSVATPAAASAATTGAPAAPQATQPAAPTVAAPTALVAVDAGESVNLRWALPPGSEMYPLLVQVTPASGRQPAPVPLPADTRAYVVTGLDRVAGYCFQAGLLLRFGDAAHAPVEMWSAPACVRGAVGATRP